MQSDACQHATETLLTYLDNPNPNPTEFETTMTHLETCPLCEKRVGHLVKAMMHTQEDELTCNECEEQLPEYFQAVGTGQASGARWRAVAYHLETCPHCAAAYAELAELTAFAFGDVGEAPATFPAPDLSFLSEGEAQPWRLDELGRLVIEFSADLIRAFQPSQAAVGLKKSDVTNILYKFEWEDEVADLEVTIIATEHSNPIQCTIAVEVNIPSRGGWPNLADTEVILKHEDVKVATEYTDAFGQVIIEGIAVDHLPQLVFEIVP